MIRTTGTLLLRVLGHATPSRVLTFHPPHTGRGILLAVGQNQHPPAPRRHVARLRPHPPRPASVRTTQPPQAPSNSCTGPAPPRVCPRKKRTPPPLSVPVVCVRWCVRRRLPRGHRQRARRRSLYAVGPHDRAPPPLHRARLAGGHEEGALRVLPEGEEEGKAEEGSTAETAAAPPPVAPHVPPVRTIHAHPAWTSWSPAHTSGALGPSSLSKIARPTAAVDHQAQVGTHRVEPGWRLFHTVFSTAPSPISIPPVRQRAAAGERQRR